VAGAYYKLYVGYGSNKQTRMNVFLKAYIFELNLGQLTISRCITTIMNLEMLKRPTIWNAGSISLASNHVTLAVKFIDYSSAILKMLTYDDYSVGGYDLQLFSFQPFQSWCRC
jgi:hypothetical protein